MDTNVILTSIRRQCLHGGIPLLRRMAAEGPVLYASEHVYREVYRRIPRMLRGTGSTLEELRTCFEEDYLPRLRFVQVPDDGGVDPEIAAIFDEDDKPTGRLAKLLEPCLVLSRDKHLRQPGFAPDDWLNSAGAVVSLVRTDASLQGAAVVAITPLGGAHLLFRSIAKLLGAKTPVVYGIATLMGTLYLLDEERRTKLKTGLGTALDALMKVMEPVLEQHQSALQQLSQDAYRGSGPRTLRQQVAHVLACSWSPLTIEEIQLQVGGITAGSYDQLSRQKIRDVLLAGGEFVQIDGSSDEWQFGVPLQPWVGPLPAE